jgi:Domain of unknown function (DUF5753)
MSFMALPFRFGGGRPAAVSRAAEAEATTLRFWGPLVVPGLLQTEGYARAYEQSADVVAARLERQQVIGRARVTAVMSTVSLTTAIRDVTSTAADVVDDTLDLFDAILGAALPAVASLAFVRTQEETWKTRI